MKLLQKLYSSVHLGSLIVIILVSTLFYIQKEANLLVRSQIIFFCMFITVIFTTVIFLETCKMSVTHLSRYWVINMGLSIVCGVIMLIMLLRFADYIIRTTDTSQILTTVINRTTLFTIIMFVLQMIFYIPICIRVLFFEEELAKKSQEARQEKLHMYR